MPITPLSTITYNDRDIICSVVDLQGESIKLTVVEQTMHNIPNYTFLVEKTLDRFILYKNYIVKYIRYLYYHSIGFLYGVGWIGAHT